MTLFRIKGESLVDVKISTMSFAALNFPYRDNLKERTKKSTFASDTNILVVWWLGFVSVVLAGLYDVIVGSGLIKVSGGVTAQSVERASSGQEVVGSIPAPGARSLLVRSVSV